MLEIIIPEQHYEPFDQKKQEFLPNIDIPETKLQLEHSLISLKKWEQKWHKPFIDKKDKTHEELTDYVRCMTLTHGVDPKVYDWIPKYVLKEIIKYIEDPMTATWFSEESDLIRSQSKSREGITAEIIYYWMISLGIPVEFQKWHLNQLLTLIKVVNIKSGKPKPVDEKTAAQQRAELNAKRRKQFNSKG